MNSFKLKNSVLIISAILMSHNVNATIFNNEGIITGSGTINSGSSYSIISTAGESNTISVANNGSVTVTNPGTTPIVQSRGEFENGDFMLTSGTVVVANSGTIDLGSGSTVNAAYHELTPGTVVNRPDLPIERDYDFVFGVGVVEVGGSSAAYLARTGHFIADDLTVNVSHIRDNKGIAGIIGDKDNADFDLNGVTTVNTTVSGANSNAFAVYAKEGTLIDAEDFAVTSQGTNYAVGISSQSTQSAAQSLVRYKNAVINVVADAFVDGISTAGGHVEALGDTLINATVNQTGGMISGYWLADGLAGIDLDTHVTSQGKATLVLNAGADSTILHGVDSVGASQFTSNDLSIIMDAQGHLHTDGAGLFADKENALTPGKITVNGKLRIDAIDTARSGTYHYIHARQGGEIALNGDVELGTGYRDPDATAILAENADSRVVSRAQNMQVVGTVEAKDSGLVDLEAINASRFEGGFLTHDNGVSQLSLAENSVWNMTKDSQLTHLTLNASSLNFMHTNAQNRATPDAASFKTLTVDGDYQGDDGNIVMNTALADDNAATDRMIVKGSTSGTTHVKVLNAGGTGGLTTNGIELISVNGTSAGTFKQDGRIVAGAYDYTLQRGAGQNAANWYLSSALSPVTPEQPAPADPTRPVEPVDPVDPVIPVNPQTPSPAPQPGEHAVRPEAGLYGVNLAAANTLFNTRLHDRLGETHYTDALTGEQAVTSMWLRNVGGHSRQHDSSEQLNMQSNRYVMQLGGDIAQWSSDNTNRYHLGLMAGYANQKSRAENQRNGNRASSSINGYSVGIYGTWLQDNDTREGAYVDTWAQYNWFDNTVSGDDVATETYKSTGFTASVESGYTWKLAEMSERNALYIQPKVQFTWMGVKADAHTEANGTRVKGNGEGNLQSRAGVRLYGHGNNKLDAGTDRTFQPFVEANWIHNSKDFGASLNGERITLAGSRTIGEAKAGVEGQLSKNITLWGNVAQQIGDKGYSDTSAMLGIKASF